MPESVCRGISGADPYPARVLPFQDGHAEDLVIQPVSSLEIRYLVFDIAHLVLESTYLVFESLEFAIQLILREHA
jgi:hypothetical protein